VFKRATMFKTLYLTNMLAMARRQGPVAGSGDKCLELRESVEVDTKHQFGSGHPKARCTFAWYCVSPAVLCVVCRLNYYYFIFIIIK
jgi:hypothetical protein